MEEDPMASGRSLWQVMAVAACANAWAEDAAPQPRRSGLIEEIVVTAQKRSESINDVPISISAFSGEDLQALGVTDTRDLGNLVPGFTAADSGYNTPVYTLRGVGFNDTTYTATSTVGVYVDEVNLPYSIMTKGASLDLERVEVLKGPQGILYGRNTTGGAINYIARKPTPEFEAGITASLARFLTTDVEGFVSGPLTETISGRLAVKDLRSQQGWQYSNTRPDDRLGKQDKQSFRGALDWAPQDTLTLRLLVEGWRDRSEPRAPQLIFKQEQNQSDPAGLFMPPQATAYPAIPQHGADPQAADWPSEDASPFIHWQLNDYFLLGALRSDWELSDTLRFTGLLSQMRVDSDGSTFPQSGYDFDNAEQEIEAHIETSALELRVSGETGEDLNIDWMLGGNASKDRGQEYHKEFVGHQSALFPDASGRSISDVVFIQGTSIVEQMAGFFNLGWRFAERYKLSLGARHTQQQHDYSGCSGDDPSTQGRTPGVTLGTAFIGLSALQAAQYTATTGEPGDAETSYTPGECFSLAENGSFDEFHDRLDEQNLSFRLALDWQPTENYLFYGSLGRGYKAGGFPVTTAARQNQFEPVTQERLDALEIGSKTAFLDGQVHANMAIYYYRYKDKQLLTKSLDDIFGPLPVLRNAPKSRVAGAELDLQFAPEWIPGLFLASTGAYTDTKIIEFVSLDANGEAFDFAGRPFNFAPRLQYSLLANYRASLSERADLTAGADYYHSASTNSTVDGDPRYAHEAYGLIGARAGIVSPDDTWSLTVFGRNLANEFYTVSVYRNGDGISRVAGMPRTYGIGFEYNFR